MEKENTFEKLYNINLTDKTKEKIGLKYLSWAYAWAELKKLYPDAERIVYKRKVTTKSTKTIPVDGGGTEVIETTYENEIPYFTDGKTCTVKVGVKINGIEYVEELPVMNNKNASIRAESVTSTDINRAIQRCFVKACALHGLGLYIYAGEDLPEVDKITIDYESLKDDKTEEITSEQFELIRKEVIQKVQSSKDDFDSTSSEELTKYILELFNGKRISLLEYPIDSANLQKLHHFLIKLYSLIKK